MHKLLIALLAFVLPTALAFAETKGGFSDVSAVHRFANSINALAALGVIGGNPDGSFAPERSINRAEFAKILMALPGQSSNATVSAQQCFDDVPAGAWFTSYVCQAKSAGIFRGDGGLGKVFRPAATITVAEMLAAMRHVFGWQITEDGGEWYAPLVSTAKGQQLFADSYRPDQIATRGIAADILARGYAVQKLGHTAFQGDADFTAITAMSSKTAPITAAVDTTATVDADTKKGAVQTDKKQYVDVDPKAIGIVLIYRVESDDIVIEEAGKSLDAVGLRDKDIRAIWERFVKLIPRTERQLIAKLVIFTDGHADTLAFVKPYYVDSMDVWYMGIDIYDAYPDNHLALDDVTYSLIHEFGHLLTLRTGQLEQPVFMDRHDKDKEAYFIRRAEWDQQFCTTPKILLPSAGCALPTSYIAKYQQAFWAEIQSEWKDVGNTDQDKLMALYKKYADRFVTEYAATSVEEDIAESWTAFVLQDKPTGTTIADQKRSFFYQFPELVQLRENIRKGL